MNDFAVVTQSDLLQRALQRMVDQMPEIADEIVRKAAFDVVAEVAERVPVDTGRLRAGWRASLEVLSSGGESDTVSVESDGEVVFLTVTNPVEYAPFIEYGTDKTAPGLQLATSLASVRENLIQEVAEAALLQAWDEST